MARQMVDPRPPIPAAYRTPERVAIQEMARDSAMNKVLPVANELDPEKGLMPDELRKEMGELGFFGILLPERHEGLARGEWLPAFAMSEPDAGSDIASIRTRADKTDGGWILNGQKMWCTFADQANGLIVVARTTPYDPDERHAGIRQFIIFKEPNTFPDGITGNAIKKVGYHGWHTYELSFNDFFVPDDGLIGYEDMTAEADANSDTGFKRTAAGMTTPRIHTRSTE